MTHLAPHPTHLRISKSRPGWWRLGLLAGLGVVAAASAAAQVQVGGTRAPSVSVDLSVLDDLGPAPNLPRLFGATRPYPTDETAQTVAPYRPALPKASKTATEKRHPATTQVARRKPSTPRRVAALSDASVRLVPPTAPSTATGGGASGEASPAPPSPNRPGPVAVASPVPAPASIPNPPSSAAAPPPPAVPAAPAHDAAPAPPSQPAGASADSAPTALTPPAPATAATAATNPGPAIAPPTPVRIAAAASAGAIVNSVKFAAGATDLPPDSQPGLNAVAAKLVADDTLRIQLVAHATGSADQAMEARRISLARAVAVRAYLIDKGVRSLRMDVRALGNRVDEGSPADQVDLLIVSQ